MVIKVVHEDTWSPTDKLMMEGLPQGPLFTQGHVSKIFFGNRSYYWIKKRLREGIYYQGEKIEVQDEVGKTRWYSLADIEKMAHGLYQSQKITMRQMRNTLRVVRAIAVCSELIEDW